MATHSQQSRHATHRPGYSLVVVLVLLTYIVTMLTDNRGWGGFQVILLQGLTLNIALFTSHAQRSWIIVGVSVATLSIVLAFISLNILTNVDTRGEQGLLNAFLYYITPIIILRDIGRTRAITTNTIMGAIAAYLIIGMAFSYIYAAVERLSGDRFFEQVANATTSEYLFFSFVTLTTVGYGNLVPAGDWGRTLATIEALFGQIYLVIVVARLVSLWKTPEDNVSG